jgi:hypothetical protein
MVGPADGRAVARGIVGPVPARDRRLPAVLRNTTARYRARLAPVKSDAFVVSVTWKPLARPRSRIAVTPAATSGLPAGSGWKTRTRAVAA